MDNTALSNYILASKVYHSCNDIQEAINCFEINEVVFAALFIINEAKIAPSSIVIESGVNNLLHINGTKYHMYGKL